MAPQLLPTLSISLCKAPAGQVADWPGAIGDVLKHQGHRDPRSARVTNHPELNTARLEAALAVQLAAKSLRHSFALDEQTELSFTAAACGQLGAVRVNYFAQATAENDRDAASLVSELAKLPARPDFELGHGV